jgi:DNA-binding NtrC family response regulator
MTQETEPNGTLLVADDEESIRWVLERALVQRGHRVVTVGNGAAALDTLRAQDFDVALVDIRMPDLSGLDLLTRAREEQIDTLVIVMTAQNTMANAIEATKRGAYDYLTKPFDLEQVSLLVDRALALRRLTRDLQRLRGELEQRHEIVIGRTPAMQEVYKVIGRVAATDATVLIEGETGTGKELVAKTIHYHPRAGPFVAPQLLRDSERAPRERALRLRAGRFTGATGGASGSPRPPRAARSSSTRSPSCRSVCRRSCCASSRSASSPGSVGATRSAPTPASRRDEPRPEGAVRAGSARTLLRVNVVRDLAPAPASAAPTSRS